MTWTIAEARMVPCPKCGADVGQPCTKGRHGGKARVPHVSKTGAPRHHQQRIDLMVPMRRAKRLAERRASKAAMSDVIES